jgi:alkylated DNA repair dioxygenase AlkB
MRLPLSSGAWLELEESWLPDADLFLAHVREALHWEQREVVIFGRRILQPRLIAWGGALPYRYSGQTLPPRALPPDIERVLERVAACAATPFNHLLANRYRDGQDSMGFHSDDEPELGVDPVVATLSLGATRRFVLRPRRKRDGPPRALELGHGSLVIMGGACQRVYHHGVPRQAHAGERISLTFRWLQSPPG